VSGQPRRSLAGRSVRAARARKDIDVSKRTTSGWEARRGSRRPRLWRALQLAAYLGLASVVTLGWAARSVYAEGERAVQGLAARIVSELGPTVVGRPQRLEINGQRLMLGSKQSTLSVREVLDRFEASCDSAGRDAGQLFADSSEVAREDASMPRPLRTFLQLGPRKLSTWRSDLETEGHASCLATAAGAHGVRGFVARTSAFLESGDLAQLGELRYLTARKLENGKTHVIAIWSEGSFRIDAMFPESGDASGSDMPDVPRPPSARRVLTAAASGHDYGMRIYASKEPATAIVSFYERELRQRGFEPVKLSLEHGTLRENVFVHAFTRSGRAVIVGVDARGNGEASARASTSVSLIDMGAARRAQVIAATSGAR
jgi:hypothetical protein